VKKRSKWFIKIRRREKMGTKGRKNVKKPKQQKDKKEKKK